MSTKPHPGQRHEREAGVRSQCLAKTQLQLHSQLNATDIDLPEVPRHRQQPQQRLQAAAPHALAELEVHLPQMLHQVLPLGQLLKKWHNSSVCKTQVLPEVDFLHVLAVLQHACDGQKVMICEAPPLCKELAGEARVEVDRVWHCGTLVAFLQVLAAARWHMTSVWRGLWAPASLRRGGPSFAAHGLQVFLGQGHALVRMGEVPQPADGGALRPRGQSAPGASA
mmetsp:Transcript_27609/g.65572  ORF Transcript_27609/g.65572 Transcript_27609/m.65572 type:complete len:224 (-) Transcript_27609:108-779(-)